MKIALCFFLILFTKIVCLAQIGAVDSTFNPLSGGNGPVSSIIPLSDSKILIFGGFTTFNGITKNYIARIYANGSIDSTFKSGSGFNARIESALIQSDGKILVAGRFTTFNGIPFNYIVRLNNDGSIDTSFHQGTGASDFINTMALQSDGKILIGGFFYYYNGFLREKIARLNSDGNLDTTFDTENGLENFAETIVIQPDGKVLVGGEFLAYKGIARRRIVRLNNNGSLDTTFNPGTGANEWVFEMALQKDGKILLGGNFTTYNGIPRNRIARLNSDGSLDISFNPGSGTNGYILAIKIQSDGKILIGGSFTTYNSIARNYITRLNNNGSLDMSFNPGGSGASHIVASIVPLNNGKVYIGGNFTTYNGVYRNKIVRIFNCEKTNSTIYSVVCNKYHSPSGKYVWYSNGIYHDTIPNSGGCDSILTINLNINKIDTGVKVNGDTLSSNAIFANYQWLKCNSQYSPVSGANSQHFIPSTSGVYAVVVTKTGCSDTSACFALIPSGIAENDLQNEMSIYPNPNSGSFNVISNNAESFILLNNIEQQLQTINYNQFNNQITIENPKSGIYYLLGKQNGTMIRQKIVVIR